MRHFKITYQDKLVKIAGNDPVFTVTLPEGKNIIIERNADGWCMLESLEQHWTDHDITRLGLLIEQKIPAANKKMS